jgi:hypothetical protein
MTGKDVPQLTHVTYRNIKMGQNDYKQLPSSIKWVFAVMHHEQQYAVMEITVATNIIKVFDGLSCLLLDWQDHITTAMKKCMLVDLHVVASLALFLPIMQFLK